MQHSRYPITSSSLLTFGLASALLTQPVVADDLAAAITGGKAYGDFRLRTELVDQDNALKDADSLTLRTRIGYKTADYQGFSALVEVEDSRTVGGVDHYNNTLGDHTEYSVVADPESTELDQALLQYKGENFTAKLGRQVLTLDNHRFVGHVGWRQDRQTFDALSLVYAPVKGLSLNYAYLGQRNRIFADDRDIDSQDHLFNVSYKTPIGKVTGYSYLLSEDDTPAENEIDTFGLRLAGTTEVGDTKLLYVAEYASQEFSNQANADFDADFYNLEAGLSLAGITAKLGYEVLGSDDGNYGFSTPLATLHKFNGWADQFLATPREGLVDAYVTVSGKLLGGKWAITYHDFKADEDTNVSDDFGSEVDLVYTRKFGKGISAGIKYAAYNAEDPANGGAKTFVHTDKLWFWVGYKF